MAKNQVILSGTIAATLSLAANNSTAAIGESVILANSVADAMFPVSLDLNKVNISEFGIVEQTSNVFDYEAFDMFLSPSQEEKFAILDDCSCNGSCK